MKCRACMDSSGPWCLCLLCETCIDNGVKHNPACHDVRPLRAELECARGTRITVAMPWNDSWSGPTPTSYRDVLSEVAHDVEAWLANKGCPCCGGCLTQRAPDHQEQTNAERQARRIAARVARRNARFARRNGGRS